MTAVAMLDLSVIVPVFNERDNIVPMVQRLTAALDGLDYEIVYVDDSTDDTPDVIAGLALHDSRIRHLRREGDAAWGRLGGAVVDGFAAARGEVFVCIDGDLQHPPEVIPELVRATQRADVAVASRYCDGGDAGGLSGGFRKFVSRATGQLSRAVFPGRLRRCSDPMSGFFAVRRSALNVDELRPKGFKILLEILASGTPKTVGEVPYTFAERSAGESHASVAEGLRWLRRLVALRFGNTATMFALVGLSGVLPNLLALLLLTNAGMSYLLAAVIGVQLGVLWTFVGAEKLVWRDRRSGAVLHRFVRYALVAELDLVRIPFVALLVHLFGGHSVTASAITLLGMFLVRFTLADRLVYRPDEAAVPPSVAEGVGR